MLYREKPGGYLIRIRRTTSRLFLQIRGIVSKPHGRSNSAEMERMIERSLGPDVEDPDNKLRDLARSVMQDFDVSGRRTIRT